MTIAISRADYKQQVELEKWCFQVGAERLLSGKWEAGASNFLLQHCASDYLNAVFQWVGQARVRPKTLGHVIDMLGDDDETIAKVALEALSFVLDINDSLKKTTLSAAIGRRSEFVLYLCHPIWGSELHLKGLQLVCGRSMGMEVMRRRLTADGFRKAEAYKTFTRSERMALGTVLLELISQTTGLIEFEKRPVGPAREAYFVKRTDKWWQFLSDWKTNLTQRPTTIPMLTPPRDWSGLTDGGFETIRTALSPVSWEQWEQVKQTLDPCFLNAVNYLQSVAWSLNREQVALQQEVWRLGRSIGSLPPRDRMERPGVSAEQKQDFSPEAKRDYWASFYRWKADQRLNSSRAKFLHGQATINRLGDADRFYLAWHSDHRGRLYQRSSHLTYTGGSDVFRSQLQFADGRGSCIKSHLPDFAHALGDAAGEVRSLNASCGSCSIPSSLRPVVVIHLAISRSGKTGKIPGDSLLCVGSGIAPRPALGTTGQIWCSSWIRPTVDMDIWLH